MASSLVALSFMPCDHGGSKKLLTFCPHGKTLGEVFEDNHGSIDVKTTNLRIKVGEYDTDEHATIGDIIGLGVAKTAIEFICTTKPEVIDAQQIVEKTTNKAVNAFQLLMAGGRSFVAPKTSSAGVKGGLNQKDVLFNSLVSDFKARKLDFARCSVEEEGKYIIQVLTNALWYITNHHNTINTAIRRDVTPVPECFSRYKDLNDEKKKKKKKINSLSSLELESHSQALYSLLMKPVMKSSIAWYKAYEDIKALADCFHNYQQHLKGQNEKVKLNQSLLYPVRTVGEHTTVEHRVKAVGGVNEKYSLLDKAIQESDGAEVFFDEVIHIEKPFENKMQRHRFLSDLHLSSPVDIYRFCPGGSAITTVCIVPVTSNRSEPEILTQAARMVLKNKKKFQEFHTRSQKKEFKQKLENVVGILPSVTDFIYKELTMDASASSHPDTLERMRLIFLGEKGLLADLRHLNPGRPSGKFDPFFEKMASIVEEVTAVDDRRHNTAHLSEWISLSDLIEKTKESCLADTPIPSKSLVRLQFAPRNPYAKTAWNFTSRIDVQYKIQRRQLRLSHPDEHYCNAQLKYLKEMAVDINSKGNINIAMVCCDDKAKVPVGEPGFAVSTGVRGKKTIMPTAVTLVSADHDMVKSSLTPSVTLNVKIPNTPEESFVRGAV